MDAKKQLEQAIRGMAERVYEVREKIAGNSREDNRARCALHDAESLLHVLAHVAGGVDLMCALGAPGGWGYGTALGDALRACLSSGVTESGARSAPAPSPRTPEGA